MGWQVGDKRPSVHTAFLHTGGPALGGVRRSTDTALKKPDSEALGEPRRCWEAGECCDLDTGGTPAAGLGPLPGSWSQQQDSNNQPESVGLSGHSPWVCPPDPSDTDLGWGEDGDTCGER